MIAIHHPPPWRPANQPFSQAAEDWFDTPWWSRGREDIQLNTRPCKRRLGVAEGTYPPEWVRGSGGTMTDGNPRCTAFVNRARPGSRDDPRQQGLSRAPRGHQVSGR